MNRATINQKITVVGEQLTLVNEKLAKLQAAKAQVEGVKVDFKYLPQDAESIKQTYQLSGKPYETMTTEEEGIVTQTKTKFEEKKGIVLSDLESAIQTESSNAGSLNLQLYGLTLDLASAKD